MNSIHYVRLCSLSVTHILHGIIAPALSWDGEKYREAANASFHSWRQMWNEVINSRLTIGCHQLYGRDKSRVSYNTKGYSAEFKRTD